MWIDIEAFTVEGGETRTIARVNWPVVPRKGELVHVVGREFGDPTRHKHGDPGEAVLKVRGVTYAFGIPQNVPHELERVSECLVTLFVEPDRYDTPNVVRLRCTCEVPTYRATSESGEERILPATIDHMGERCDDCGCTISRIGKA
jgi:hypothetical protein